MKIHNKLFLILFSFSLFLVTALVLLIEVSISKGMNEYVNSKEIETLKPAVIKLLREYKIQNNWSTMKDDHQKLYHLIVLTLKNSTLIPVLPSTEFIKPRRPSSRKHFRTPPRSHGPPSDQPGYALLDNKRNIIAGYTNQNSEYNKMAIIADGVNVGWLAVPKKNKITEGYELDFIKQQKNYIWLIALITMMLVICITRPLSRHLVEPIKLIILGMHKLSQGDYQQYIDLKRQDELGELSRDFNKLAITLHENESARKRWLANISHELRTPVAILRAELEAIIDGVRPLSKKGIYSANDEVKHLQRLIDDLQQLTSADIGGMHYRKQANNLASWLNEEAKKHSGYLEHAGIKLEIEISDDPVEIFSDTTRLCQLFDNIMNNCIKYAQASVVKISLKIDKSSATPIVVVKVEDNGVGVSEVHLTHLFEHLYRVENSRNRQTGGSGLGLSICAHIVSAHKGKISAEKSDLGGLAIIIELPLIK